MSETPELLLSFRSELWDDAVRFSAHADGELGIEVRSRRLAMPKTTASETLLPAADARRLLAWLRERYPEETTNG